MPLTKNEVGEDIPKPSRDWNDFEKRKASLNSKAMNALFCALDKKEFHRVSSYESANEIWHKLEVVYEGTNQVKESKISRYTRQYELFQMEQNENVYSMYTRFTDIVNTLGALGKTFSNSEKVKKIIRSLPKEWRQKRTAIEEAKDLNILPIDDLIGSLISYEEDLAVEKGHEEKKKNIALKASKHESDEESEMDDEELAMLARRFRKFYKKNNEQRKFRGYKNKKEKKESITCYECKKPGHIRSECPLLNKFKKKAMVATWDDSDEETSDNDEYASLSGKFYAFVIVDDYSRYTWVLFLANKDYAIDAFRIFYKKAEAVNTACYVLNRVLIRPNLNKTPYELWKDRKSNIGYFKVFGCKCFVLNTKDNLGKFDPKSDVGIFLGYSNSSKAYRVYNKRTLVVEESMHVTFDEFNHSSTEKVVVDDNAEEEQQEETLNDNQEDAPRGIQEEHHEETNAEQNEGTSQALPKEWRYISSHPKDVILGDPSRGVTTRSSLRNTCEHAAFISQIEPKSFADAENDESWIMAMQEELNQFERNNVWELVPNPEHQSIIDFSSCMSQEFDMSMMGELKYLIGLQIKQNEEGIFINQAKYVKDLLKRFGYDNGTAKSTPMSTTIKLDKDEKGKKVDIKTYRGMIRSLLYLTTSRPDIMFSVCLCARFQSCPKESHMLAVKRIFRYLIGTINLGLWYPRGTHIDLTCYSDAEFAGYKISHRNLFQLLGDVGWIDALLIEENVYPDLVKVFYSNMDCSAEKENRVITTVGGVLIEFDDSELNSILGSSDDGLDIFSLRKPLDIDDYVHVDVVRNICRRSDLSVEDCTIHFRTQCLCLQTRFLLRIIQSLVLRRSGHLDEVSHMDVAMIDCILRGRPVYLDTPTFHLLHCVFFYFRLYGWLLCFSVYAFVLDDMDLL
ncbi:hypothetical protein KPL70_017266 [Citrus sinensis]|nr:hypothetical protein KPL70_017266 [Citrus sinensis]